MLTREQLLDHARDRLLRESVDVPELGGEVMLWEMTGAERNGYDAALSKLGKSADLDDTWRTLLLVRAIKNEQGEPMFTTADVGRLGEALPARAIPRLWAIAARLSGLTIEDVEDLRKNSASGSEGGSASGSLTVSG